MSLSKPNASAATLTKNRTPLDISPFSGMCATCIEGCVGLCEIGKSAYRGSEAIYPQPFGPLTAASQKDYPVDLSHFNIMGTCVGAYGIKADSDIATFPNVNIETRLGRDKKIKLRLPIVTPGLGSTDVAKRNWEGIAVGSAISGTVMTIGENVCGMDENAVIKNGRVVHSQDLEHRVRLFKEWQDDGYGAIVVQSNVEDGRLGVLEYAIDRLGVNIVELKWGQGAKDIGGEVKITDLRKAQLLKRRGYIVLPDPEDPVVIDAFERKVFKEFERHSRIGMVEENAFHKRVAELRRHGAKYIFLKTGAYRPVDLARAMRFSSDAGIDALTVDGAGGGTGMSPWRMMNEWGVPTVELASLAYYYARRLSGKKKYVPDIIIAGGFTLEDHIFKGLALGAPYFKAIGMARAPIAAAMVGKTIARAIKDENIPSAVDKYGKTMDEIFITVPALKKKYGKRFEKLPVSAIAVYTYYQRLAQGLKQLMCGSRKFSLPFVTRGDIASLTRQATDISGITYIMDVDREEAEKLL